MQASSRTPSPRRAPAEETPPVRPRRDESPVGGHTVTPLKLSQPSRSESKEAPSPSPSEGRPLGGAPLPPPGLDEADDAAPEEPLSDEDVLERKDVKKVWDGKSSQRQSRVLQLVCELLQGPEAQQWTDSAGYVPLSKLLRLRSELQRESFGSSKLVVTAVESAAQSMAGCWWRNGRASVAAAALRLDKSHRRVRLQTAPEMVREAALSMVGAAAEGVVTLAAICEALKLLPLQKEVTLAEVQLALQHEDSEVDLSDDAAFVLLRPRCAKLRRAAEELFSDAHLQEDSRLRMKLMDSRWGEVPLAWLCSRYAERLGGELSSESARAVESAVQELSEALLSSQVLFVDARRSTVRRFLPYKESSKKAAAPAPGKSAAVGDADGGTVVLSRAAAQLRQLLDFYFEPFTIQNNRFLLDLIMRSVGPPDEKGPWVAETLADFSCSVADLTGLGRIASAVAKIKKPEQLLLSLPRDDGGNALKHLTVGADGRLHLSRALEVRNFVAAEGVPPEKVAAVVHCLTAAREQRSQSLPQTVTVISYTIDSCTAAVPEEQQACQQQRQARVKRQLLVHKTDIVCLQGLDPEDGAGGASLATTLSQDGYAFAATGRKGNAIFWDRSRWESVAVHDLSGEAGPAGPKAIAVDLRSFSTTPVFLRVVSMKGARSFAQGSGRFEALCGPQQGMSLLVSADLGALGGAEAAALVPGLAALPSAAEEVLGEEIAAPAEGAGEPAKVRASGLNKVHRPDAVLYDAMMPITVLSGHTEGYLATMGKEDVLQQFPAFRTPIVAAFDLKPEEVMETCGKQGGGEESHVFHI